MYCIWYHWRLKTSGKSFRCFRLIEEPDSIITVDRRRLRSRRQTSWFLELIQECCDVHVARRWAGNADGRTDGQQLVVGSTLNLTDVCVGLQAPRMWHAFQLINNVQLWRTELNSWATIQNETSDPERNHVHYAWTGPSTNEYIASTELTVQVARKDSLLV